MKLTTKLWLGVAVLAILSPLGLILPEYFKAGSAWGEWGIDEMQKLAGYIPRGMGKLSLLWNAPLPDYAFTEMPEHGLAHSGFAYLISAVIGIAAVAAVTWGIGRFLSKK